jgi:hypothetical protein
VKTNPEAMLSMASPREKESKIVSKVFLWCAPRSLSNAFERAIRNLKGGKCLHEPYADVYYFGPQRKSRRYANEPVQPKATLEEVSKDLVAEYNGEDFIFSKDMAFHLDGNYDVLCQEGLREYKHSFLIRNPKKTVLSLYRCSVNSKQTKGGYFSPEEVGFRELLELYEFVVKEFDSSPVIVDADDLLKSPEEMMKKYCEATGLVYEENMTSWASGSVPEWDACRFKGWHDAAIKSTGIGRKPKEKESECCSVKASDEKEVNYAINDSLRYYKVLYEKRLRLPSNTCAKDQS